MSEVWPSSHEVHTAVAERIDGLLDETAGIVADTGRRTLAAGHGILSREPHSLVTVLVPGACLSAGEPWRLALWPAVAAECLMAAADLFDDVADADQTGASFETPAVVLTAAAGLLALAGAAVVRVVADGAPPTTAVALAALLGCQFARAANGQAANLETHQPPVDALAAYRQAAAKSGPLGALIGQLGARTATTNVEIVELLGAFGRHLGIRSQLLNDARDASPTGSLAKADVRAGARTVPLAFARSRGAPGDLSPAQLAAWETHERARVASAGGLIAASALAEAERLGAIHALDSLQGLGCRVRGLRQLVE
jgi:geranylgeranyl pyrophosphate synthase